MERNETATNARLKALREGLIAAKAIECGGRIVDTAGDRFLLEFASATFAVRCAIAIQREMRARNRRLAPDMRIDFRIGINLGDVIVDGDDIAGNGINVAARLEALCDPGGICLSASVRDQLHDDLGVEFLDIGEQRVKNLERPVRAYRAALLRKTRSLASSSGVEPTPPTAAPTAGRDISIAVLPFTNLSSDPANEYFADGLAEELLNVLAGVQGLRVVPRTSSFYFKGKRI